MTAEQLWKEFSSSSGITAGYTAWQFGDDADRLAALVSAGKKTATSSAYPLYALENEPLPEAGEYSVILDSREEAVCIIRTDRVYVAPFCEIDARHACLEGEGDRSLEYWRRVHADFFESELRACGLEFDENMQVVCEEFSILFRGK